MVMVRPAGPRVDDEEKKKLQGVSPLDFKNLENV